MKTWCAHHIKHSLMLMVFACVLYESSCDDRYLLAVWFVLIKLCVADIGTLSVAQNRTVYATSI